MDGRRPGICGGGPSEGGPYNTKKDKAGQKGTKAKERKNPPFTKKAQRLEHPQESFVGDIRTRAQERRATSATPACPH